MTRVQEPLPRYLATHYSLTQEGLMKDTQTKPSIRSYKDLTVWQKAMDLAVMVYRITRGFPAEERFTMVPQLRGAASSIPSNIAEGWGRESTAEYARFASIAQGSSRELETRLIICQRVGLLTPEVAGTALALNTEVSKMLKSLIGSLRRRK